mmetsp:Transcript_15358/g.27401  ORF Transcript_15358/g.27401 Transcript_15358/m.27401 type:complete len:855 (+) Transcript_15358:76-2640(+)
MANLGMAVRGQNALRRQFPHVDEDALALFAESVDEPDMLAALVEMQREAQAAAGKGGRDFLPTRDVNVECRPPRERPDCHEDPVLKLEFEGGEDPPRIGTVLVLRGLDTLLGESQRVTAVAMATPSGEVLTLEPHCGPTCFFATEYGMHELRVQMPGGALRRDRFMVTSQLGDFAEALDLFHDACDWVWDGQWTDELEEATIGLLAALDDHFSALQAAFGRSPLGETMSSEIGPSKRRLEDSLQKALESHDPQAVGRVYGAVRSVLQSQALCDMFGPMMGGMSTGPMEQSALYESVLMFEKARFAAASDAKRAEVKSILSRLISAADAHIAMIQDERSSGDVVSKWRGGLRDTFVQMRDDPEAIIHPLPFQQLRGGGSSYIIGMMKSMSDAFGGQSQSQGVQRSETIEAVSQLGPQAKFQEADDKVSRWAESLVDESVSFGSLMQPFELHDREPWVQTALATLRSVLSLGFGYVTQCTKENREASSCKMVLLLDRVRATLPLDAEDEFLEDKRRVDRLKDVCRVVRAAKRKGQRLSLSVNTDFAGALRALKEHHADSWVGESLEAVWTKMAAEKQCFVFELWLHEAQGSSAEPPPPRLIAADFGNPHTNGKAYYVATRFFDRSVRTLQPGFILAFAEAMCLKRAGFSLWDLGGADHSPMMQYKPQVAIEMNRSDFLRRLREVRRSSTVDEGTAGTCSLSLSEPAAAPPHGGERMPTGVVCADIVEEELWGTKALQARDESAKKLQAAANEKAIQAAKERAKKGQQKAGKSSKKAATKKNVETKPVTAPSVNESQHEPSKSPEKECVKPAQPQDQVTGPGKAHARQQFVALFQQLIAEGVPQNEAAAKALLVVSR